MSYVPPWLALFLALLLLAAMAAWVLQRGLTSQTHAAAAAAWSTQEDVQSQAHRRIQQQHLKDLDSALAEGRLNTAQHAVARDEALRHLLADATPMQASGHPVAPVRWAWVVLALAVLSAVSYLQLGAPWTWWPVP